MKKSLNCLLRYCLPVIISACFALSLFAQKDEAEQPFKVDGDTLYALVDHSGEILNIPGQPYYRKWWPNGSGRYIENLFYTDSGRIARIAEYSDKELKVKNGLYLTFHGNGMMKDSGYYVNNKKQGVHAGWYEDGEQYYMKKFKDDIPVDTCYTFMNDGQLASVSITDSLGNGLYQQYRSGGKVLLIGRLLGGNRNGIWQLKREDGSKRMEINYLKDSIIQTICYDADGFTRLSGDCVFEKPAAYPGGNEKWVIFLEKNLRYPEYAIDKNIEGRVFVKFLVDKEGNASDFEIISSPDKSLSIEVLRLMKKSGKWEPAIQYNQKVTYRHIQGITFRLK